MYKAKLPRGLPTLIFPVTSLDLLMMTFLDLPLQNSCPRRLVVIRNFEDVSGIDEVVISPTHDMIAVDVELEHWYLD